VSWSYDGRDIGISFFDACLKAGAPMRFEPGMYVLEVGCCESDWLYRACRAWPEVTYTGLDVNVITSAIAGGGVCCFLERGDAMRPQQFAPESFDAAVAISSIEHIGLGHYGDPIDPDGDSKALANIWRWLKPGGWLYFDVPYDPTKYYLAGEKQTECRVYDDVALMRRLVSPFMTFHQSGWSQQFRAYMDLRQPSVLIDKPTAPHPTRYWCVGMVWQKA